MPERSSDGIVLRGLTWGHRRAIAPLEAAQERFEAESPGIAVRWEVRELQKFEHQPLESIVGEVDFVVFDHPFIGRIDRAGLFLPIDDVLAQVPGAADAASYIGPSLDTYRWMGRTWGIPMDGATMHALYRPDLMAILGLDAPRTWDEVLALARAARRRDLHVGLANHGHHGFLAIGSLMYNLGAPWTGDGGRSLSFDAAAFRECLGRLRALSDLAHPGSADWNAIGLHDAMTGGDSIVYCPLAYGYATYGEADFAERRLAFAASPGIKAPFAAGTLVGGAALGISARTAHREAAKRYAAFVLRADVQSELFAKGHGQPARIEAWRDEALDRRFNGFFGSVAETMALSGMRPRFDGYSTFEKEAGALTNRHMRGDLSAEATVEGVLRLAEATGTAG